jgi:hypothetical protein
MAVMSGFPCGGSARFARVLHGAQANVNAYRAAFS